MNNLWNLAFSLLHLATALLASAHVIISHPRARGAALWVGIIWLVPWLGPVLYLILGVNRTPRRALPRVHLRPDVAPAWCSGNRLRPLIGGDAAYARMLAEIEAAKSEVCLSTYIFDNDRAGQMFREALGAAVARGVAVRVLIDAVGARYSHPPILRSLLAVGVDAALFLPTTMPWRWRYANLRSHRKLMTVDRRLAFTGGMNIREHCMASLSPSYPTLDVHFQVEGPVVEDIVDLFEADWAFTRKAPIPSACPPIAPLSAGVRARLVSGGPDHLDEPVRWLKLAAVVRAKRRVRIVTPYFVPDEDVLSAILAAASAGVQIQIVLPSENNLRLVAWASRASFVRLIAQGVDIVLSPPPFEHTKVMLVDDELVIVGSANWDERSFRLNFEADIECVDGSLSATLDEMVDARIQGGTHVSQLMMARARLSTRLRDGLARLATPYL